MEKWRTKEKIEVKIGRKEAKAKKINTKKVKRNT